MADFPGAEGARRPWETLPAHVRDEIESRVGSRVAVAATQPGGFSPGVAARLTMRTGERVFVKAVSSAPNPDSPGFHRREAAVAAALPASAPTPRLRFVVDDGDTVALVFDDIDGRSPLLPWTSADLDLVLEAVDRLSHTLTPSPIALAPASEHLATTFTGWRSLRGDAGRAARLEPDWRARLDALADLEAGWAGGAGGSTLLHLDLRADNLLIGRDGVVVVDWPHACVGAAWIDLAGLLPSVAMQGGPPPSAIWSAHPVARPAPRDAVDGVVAALAGFFTSQSLPP